MNAFIIIRLFENKEITLLKISTVIRFNFLEMNTVLLLFCCHTFHSNKLLVMVFGLLSGTAQQSEPLMSLLNSCQ